MQEVRVEPGGAAADRVDDACERRHAEVLPRCRPRNDGPAPLREVERAHCGPGAQRPSRRPRPRSCRARPHRRRHAGRACAATLATGRGLARARSERRPGRPVPAEDVGLPPALTAIAWCALNREIREAPPAIPRQQYASARRDAVPSRLEPPTTAISPRRPRPRPRCGARAAERASPRRWRPRARLERERGAGPRATRRASPPTVARPAT